MLKQLSFEIQESPVLYNHNGQVLNSSDHKGIIKDDGTLLSIMKKTYEPMYNSDFIESVNRMETISGFKNHGYSEFNGGRIVFAHLKNTETGLTISGSEIRDYLVMGTSHDGSYPFFFGTTTDLLRCKNQFSKIAKFDRVLHRKSAPRKLEELFKSLEVYFQERKKMYEHFEMLSHVKVDQATIQLAQDYVLRISKEDRLEGKISTYKQNRLEILNADIIGEIEGLGDNAWALFNGFTKYVTHHLPDSTKKSFGNLFGTPALLNNRAMDFVTELSISN